MGSVGEAFHEKSPDVGPSKRRPRRKRGTLNHTYIGGPGSASDILTRIRNLQASAATLSASLADVGRPTMVAPTEVPGDAVTAPVDLTKDVSAEVILSQKEIGHVEAEEMPAAGDDVIYEDSGIDTVNVPPLPKPRSSTRPIVKVRQIITRREHEVLSWVFIGKSNIEIGKIMGLSALTVKNHIQKLLRKLNAENRTAVIRHALAYGVLKPPAVREPAFIGGLPRLKAINVVEKPEVLIDTAPVEPPPPPFTPAPGFCVYESGKVFNDGVPIVLGKTEFNLLKFLITHRSRVYSRDQLLDQVWGRDKFVEERTVDVHIRRLREALGENSPWLINTIRGVGYQMQRKDEVEHTREPMELSAEANARVDAGVARESAEALSSARFFRRSGS